MFAAAEMRAELTKTLTEDENRLLDLLLDGFTTEEIAQRLGISYDSSGVRLHRLRGKIRKLLTDKGIF